MEKTELIQLLDKKSKKTYNPNCDIYEGKFYFGFKLDLDGQKKNLFIFDDGSFEEDFSTELLQEEHQISNDGLKRFLNSEKIEPKTMYDDSIKLSKEFLELDDIIYDILTLWNIHTFGINLFGVTPYIHIKGNKDSGKSTIMKFCSKLTQKSEYVINPSKSSLFRGIDISQNTVFIDEFENYDDTNKKEIITILNSGYTEGGSVPRTEQIKNGFCKVKFKTFCPKMFSSIDEIETNTLRSRTIELYTIRNNIKLKNLDKLKIEDKEKFTKLRDDYYLFWLQNWKKIEEIYDNLPDMEFYGRRLQLIKPILTLSKFFGNYEKVLEFFKKEMEEKQDSFMETDRNFTLLQVLYEMLDGKETRRISVKELVEKMNDKRGYDEHFQYKFTTKNVGKQLHRLKFTQYKINLSDGKYYDFDIKIIKDRIKREGYEHYFKDLNKEEQIRNEINNKTCDYMDEKYGIKVMEKFNEQNGYRYEPFTKKYKLKW